MHGAIGNAMAQFVQELRYRPKGRRFDSQTRHWHNPSSRTMALGLTQPLTEMSTRNISWGGKGGWCVRLTTLPPSCADSWNLGASTSWNPQGLSRPVMGLLYLFYMVLSGWLILSICITCIIQLIKHMSGLWCCEAYRSWCMKNLVVFRVTVKQGGQVIY